MKKKVTYIISDIKRALAFEWIATYLDKDKFDLSFVLLNSADSVLEQHLREKKFDVIHIHNAGKKTWIAAWLKLYSYFKKEKPDIVHCHLQTACILGLSAAKIAGIRVRIYTRHHSSLHHVYFPKGVFWDKWLNRMATHIVSISGELTKILTEWEKVPKEKIYFIPHGFLLEEFAALNQQKLDALYEKYQLLHAHPVIGVISRFTEWKGVQYIIPAFKNILTDYPSAILLLFNAGGDYEKEINTQLSLLPSGSYRAIQFEPDISCAYHLMNICVHVPIDEHSEAFGQVYIEALAAGIPLVATKSGIANDILVHKKNAWLVAYKDSKAITEGIKALLTDKELVSNIVQKGKETANDFSLQKMIFNLNQLYDKA